MFGERSDNIQRHVQSPVAISKAKQRNLLKHKFRHITFVSSSSDLDIIRMKIERFIMGLYSYRRYKTKKVSNTIKTVDFVINHSKNLKKY